MTLGDLRVAKNGTGYKKAKSLKSLQQSRCYLQELIRCLVKHFVVSASDVVSHIPIKT